MFSLLGHGGHSCSRLHLCGFNDKSPTKAQVGQVAAKLSHYKPHLGGVYLSDESKVELNLGKAVEVVLTDGQLYQQKNKDGEDWHTHLSTMGFKIIARWINTSGKVCNCLMFMPSEYDGDTQVGQGFS